MDATIRSKIPYENTGMVTTIQKDSGMVATIQSKESCINNPRNLDFYNLSQGLESRFVHCIISNMTINVLKSSILENHLITNQWCEPLTSARETTSNVNGSQGNASTIHKVWRMIWSRTLVKSIDQRPMMQAYRRMRRTCDWGVQAPRYPKGVSISTSWIMSWCR